MFHYEGTKGTKVGIDVPPAGRVEILRIQPN